MLVLVKSPCCIHLLSIPILHVVVILLWYHIYRRSLCWVFCEDIELVNALPAPFIDFDDCFYEPIEPSPGNPFGIEPDYVEWMDEDNFTYY
jgi:hypothetical protein